MSSQLTFNYGKTLTLCIVARNNVLSLKQQLQRLALLDREVFERMEIIVVDNDSSDGTSTVARQFEGRVPFKYVSNTENLSTDNSFTFALNKAIAERSKYIWMLDARYVLRVGCFEKLLELLENNEFGLVHFALGAKSRKPVVQYVDTDDFLQAVGMGIIDTSRNLIRTDYIRGYNPRDFRAGSGIPAVPLLMYVSLSGKQNAVFTSALFDAPKIDFLAEVNDPVRVYAGNLINIYDLYEDEDKAKSISPVTLMRMKNSVSDFLLPLTMRLFILRRGTKGIDPKASRQIVKQQLGWRPLLSALKRCVSAKLWGGFFRFIGKMLRRLLMFVVTLLTLIICNTLVTRACRYIRNSIVTFRFRHRVKVGKGCVLEGTVAVEGKNIRIGTDFYSKTGLTLESLNTGNYTPKITLGDSVRLERNVRISAIREIRVGNNVQVGQNVLITDFQYGKTDTETLHVLPADRQPVTRGAVVIEDNVIIGPGAIVLSGVTVGKGAVIAAGAVVSRNVPPFSVAKGVPARVVR